MKRKYIYHKKCWSIFSQQYQWRTFLVFVVVLLMSSWAVEFLYSSRPLMQTTFYRAALTRRVPHPPRSPRVTSLASLCSPVALTPTGASVSCSVLVSVSALCFSHLSWYVLTCTLVKGNFTLSEEGVLMFMYFFYVHCTCTLN